MDTATEICNHHPRATSAADYPSTEREGCHFAIRYLKWLMSCGASTEIGPDAVAVLVAVVTLEDEVHHRYAPNFYNEQLAHRCGMQSTHALIRARQRAIDAGLLHYEPGAKRSPGRYWVLGFDAESAWHEAEFSAQSASNPEGNPNHTSNAVRKAHRIRKESAECSAQSASNPLTSIPNTYRANLIPKKESALAELEEWISTWNAWHDKHLVPSRTSATKAVTKAWKKSQTDPEIRTLLADRSAIATAIERSNFVREGSWFRLEKLLVGRNKDGELIVRLLIDGAYANKQRRTANTGPGVTFDPKRSYANVSF
jgi:hypothetical protein